MAIDVAIGNSSQLTLAHAILIYTAPNQDKSAYATLHDVEQVDGRPEIRAGRPPSEPELITIFRDLANANTTLTVLPEGVLATTLGTVVWYRPPSPALLWFAEKIEALHPLSGRPFHQPGLIFVAGAGTLRARAYTAPGRPTAETRLYRAPYFNVNAAGTVCLGSAPAPSITAPETIAAWEDAFFVSRFSHANTRENELTTHPRGLIGYWLDRSARRKPRAAHLTRSGETLETFLKSRNTQY